MSYITEFICQIAKRYPCFCCSVIRVLFHALIQRSQCFVNTRIYHFHHFNVVIVFIF
ncbi:MAG: BC10 family protein [Oscillospiraceae bacterium]|nr:BC10 family protein [Oscillospiraceae bacterium]